uniref:Eukaryotic peptide chain release factor subunit 1 n=1 Tax=Didinium nasutum TaxID=5997 RepID=ERF1_DIDNA|nr:RecName: Full=Eukaryotic peptide chain release factor subunit 1; Short=Eukaryotic release factor 1; Short=eRF1 [Didinium nasutum]BAD90943.1 eukaryotic release factor 1 [Didinium nasutum]
MIQSEEDLEYERNVEMFRLKRLIAKLESMKGSGTSMITLIINFKDQINIHARMLAEEVGKASNIKSRVTRQNVTDALTSTLEKLKLYNKTPPNGLVIFCGLVQQEDGGEKMIKIDLEPFKPINTTLYKCDSVFHTEEVRKLLEDNDKFGFIIMDGNGSLFGTLQGSTRTVLLKFNVDLPKKHGRGGQSANRFARIRIEKRRNYLRKVAESTTACFITNDMPNVKGLILAGSAEFKNDLQKSDLFDLRLQPIVIKLVDISYGGENGFNQAIELSSDALKSVKFIHEKKVIGKFFDEIAKDTGKYVFGIKDTLEAMDMGSVDILIIYENLEYNRLILRDANDNIVNETLHKNKCPSGSKYKNETTGVEYEVLDNIPLTEWFMDNYKKYVSHLEIVTDKSSEGSQFLKGFGGIGGILRYKMDTDFDDTENNNEWNDDDFI